MNKPSFVLAANAVPRQGGQGLNLQHMQEAFNASYDLQLFSRAPSGARNIQVPQSQVSTLLGRVPWVRRRNDWRTLASDLHFDRFVASRLPRADFFQGVVGQCAESLAAAKRQGTRTVLDVVNTHVDNFREHIAREARKFGLPSFIGPTMHRRILDEYAQADVVRVMSERAKATFLERGFPEGRLVVATPPMSTEDFPQATFESGSFRVSFVGLLEPWKGFHYLLDAFSRVSRPDAELVLWGGPGSRAASRIIQEAQARDRRIVLRAVEVRQVGYAEVYGKTSVLVHPSLADGFSYAVAEAMASGVPVIVTDNTGAADLVQDGESGYVVPTADPTAIADRLQYLADHPERLTRMGQKAREAVARLTPEAFRRPLVERLASLS